MAIMERQEWRHRTATSAGSRNQLQDKTAWYLEHRIREAMTLRNFTDEKMTGTVEMEEAYIGGEHGKRRKRERWTKTRCSASSNVTPKRGRHRFAPPTGRASTASFL
jgi:hypothetical protein